MSPARDRCPQSIIAFLESENYEDAVRNAVSLGGDADTMAAIAGGIAEAFYGGVPEPIRAFSLALLEPALRAVVEAFTTRFSLCPPAPDQSGAK